MTTKSNPLKKTSSQDTQSRWQRVLLAIFPQRGVGALLLGGERDRLRLLAVIAVMGLAMIVIIVKAAFVQLTHRDTYIKEGDKFLVTTRTQPVFRGMIKDRFGTPLAADAPLVVMVFSPYDYAERYYQLKKQLLKAKTPEGKQEVQAKLNKMDLSTLAKFSKVPLETLEKSVALKDIDVYDKKAVKEALPYVNGENGNLVPYRWLVLTDELTPKQAMPLEQLKFVAVSKQIHHRRYYMQGESVAQVVGFMSKEDNHAYQSRSGAEKKYETQLAGKSGQVLLLKTPDNQPIQQIKEKSPIVPSQDITLTIDARLQYILYKELERMGRVQEAMWTSGIITDIHTGEVLAMGAWPALNSNVRNIKGGNDKNRATQDIFESGSVMKPFTIVAALESNKYNTNTLIDTKPGSMRVLGKRINDAQNYGLMNLSDVIQKSSNVGIAKIILNLPQNAIFDVQKRFGFGQRTALEYPYEQTGNLTPPKNDISKRITMGYGYGQDVTLAQLAQAYATLGADGVMHPLRISTIDPKRPPVQVTDAKTAQAVLAMMERVTMKGGTGTEAAINGYRVAGKTGTARRANPVGGGYLQGEYRNLFAGVAPASNPRFAVVILIESPQKDKVAGKTAAPVFSRVMGETLRIYNVPFDKPLDVPQEQPN